MTFKECARAAWKDNPFQAALIPLKTCFWIIFFIIAVLAITAGPPILVEDYFISRDLKGVFALLCVVYWLVLIFGGSFLIKMYSVCKVK